jgi:hypothetical protein
MRAELVLASDAEQSVMTIAFLRQKKCPGVLRPETGVSEDEEKRIDNEPMKSDGAENDEDPTCLLVDAITFGNRTSRRLRSP